MMQNSKTIKKGELLALEGENITSLFMISAGRVSVFVERAGKKIEIMTLNASSVVGEAAIFAAAKHPFSVEAQIETKVIEVPIDVIRAQLNAAPATAKVLLKNLTDQVKFFQGSYRTIKMEQEKSACPQMVIPKIFTILNVVARLTGQKVAEKPNEVIVDWGTLKIQTSRLFLDSPPRMRSLLDLMLKLKHLELRFEKNEDGDEELSKITLLNLQLLEDFSEFYQYNLFKGGRSEIIYLDPLAHRVGKAMSELVKAEPVDRKGSVRVDYQKMVNDLKTKHHIELKEIHLNALEKKGLFVKRVASETEVILMFDKVEFERVIMFWDIIAEIDLWNEKGFVDLTVKLEPIALVAAEAGSPCPSCKGLISESHRFCPHCGFKVAA